MKSFSLNIIEIGRMQAGLFENNNQVYIDCLVKFESPRHILTLAYSALVASKQIKSIESLPIEEKNKLWALTKEFAAGKLEKNKTLELSKALYTLEFYLQ